MLRLDAKVASRWVGGFLYQQGNVAQPASLQIATRPPPPSRTTHLASQNTHLAALFHWEFVGYVLLLLPLLFVSGYVSVPFPAFSSLGYTGRHILVQYNESMVIVRYTWFACGGSGRTLGSLCA